VPDDAPETVIVDASHWLFGSISQLTRRLAKGPAVVAPRGTGRNEEGVSVVVRAPAYWAGSPDALAEVLQIAALTDPDSAVRFRARVIPAEERLTLTVEEAARLLGISRAFAYEAVRRGEIPSIRIGRRVLVPKAALKRLVGSEPQSPDE
jgi:excisionase family DNA binding protein